MKRRLVDSVSSDEVGGLLRDETLRRDVLAFADRRDAEPLVWVEREGIESFLHGFSESFYFLVRQSVCVHRSILIHLLRERKGR